MAVTNYKRQEAVARQNGGNTPYDGMNGVSKRTAQNVGNYQAGYTPSETVLQAQNTLKQAQNNKPASYASKYSGALENILQQIQNPEGFKYSFDGDELFKAYADLYTQKGKQASMDAMGQAAAQTGGYGNSYGQMVGQQQYQQNLLPLYEMGLNLSDRAYQRYQDERADNYNKLAALQGMDEIDYGRYRDTVGDWERELQRAIDAERYEREFDYNDYANMLDYWTGLAQIENAAWNTEQDRQEAIREYNQDFAEKVRQFNEDMAENQRQFNENLNWTKEESARDFAQRQYEYNTDNQFRYDQFNWQKDIDARDYARRVLENDRDYDRSVFESDRNYNRGVLESDRDYQLNTDKFNWQRDIDARDYAEQVRQADLDEAYRQAQFGWQQSTDARDFNESVRQNDQKLAYNYAMAILANGQMPSAEMLAAAGLSDADARAMMPQVAPATGGTGGKNRNGGNMTVYESVNGKYYTINDDKVKEVKPETIPNEAIVSDRVIGKDWKSPQTVIKETMNSEAGKKAAKTWAEEQAAKAKTSTGNIFTDFAKKVTEAQKKKKK